MLRPSFRRALPALSLSLLLASGCAAPVAAPTSPAAPQAAQPVAVSQLGEASAPAAVTPATAATPPAVTLDGNVSYRGEKLAGYTLQVLDGQTGLPVTLVNDLAQATGLAVLNAGLVTDAQGAFSLQVANLTAGHALRVVATKDHVSLEAVVLSSQPPAATYTVAQAKRGLTVSELSTTIARIARGIVRTTQVLSPGAAQPVLDRLNARLQALAPRLQAELDRNPAFAGELIRPDSTTDSLSGLVGNANMLQELTMAAAELVAEVGRQAQTEGNRSAAAGDPAVQAQLAQIELAGTVLRASFDPTKGTLNLTNRVSGMSIEAANGDVTSLANRLTPNKGRRGPAFAEAFHNVRLHALDAKWTMAAIKLAPGLTPADFRAFEAKLYDGDDNVLTTATAEPTEFRVADRELVNFQILDTESRGRQHPYFLPIIFKRVWGQSVKGGDCDDLLNLQADSPRARKWNVDPKMPGLPESAFVTVTFTNDTLIDFSVSDDKIQNLDPAKGGSFSINLRRKQWDGRDVASIHVDLLDRRGDAVGSADATEMHLAALNDVEATTTTRVKFRPAHRTENDTDWTYGPFLGKSAKLVLRFTDRNGHVHESIQEAHREDYEPLRRNELTRVFDQLDYVR